MIKLKPFRQSPGFCGPASLKMVLEYYGILTQEKELAILSGATKEKGTSAEGLIAAAKHFGLNAFGKENSSFHDIERYINKGIPVIVDWFSEDDGHYSVVVDMNKKEITLMDPTLRRLLIYVRRRKMPLEKFYRIWFDFQGDYLKSPADLILRRMIVVAPAN